MKQAVELTEAESQALDEMAKRADLSREKLILQALRLYNLVQARQMKGETMTWVDEQGKPVPDMLSKLVR